MEAPQHRPSKDIEQVRSPAQTSSRGTPRFKRPVQHTPSPTKLQYGDAFLITTVDGQHCLCPNLFDASIYLIPMRFVKESGFFPLCCFTFDRMQKVGGGLLQDSAASGVATSPYVFAGEDLNIRHRASGQFIQFDDLNSPHQEPAHSCASMTNHKCSNSRLRLQYRVTVDAEARFMLSHTEISISAHAGDQSYLCPAHRSSQDWCIEAVFASDRQASWIIEPLATADAEAMACSSARPPGIRCGCSGRIKNIQGLTLSYHPTALFPVFIPLDSVTSDGSWTDPSSVWSLWTLEDPVDCFNLGYSSATVQLRHLITARLIRMGGPCRRMSSDSNNQAAFINMIGIAEGRGSQFSVYHIDQNRFMLSYGGSDAEPLAVQSTPMGLEVLDCLPLDDHLFASVKASNSLSTAAPGCSRLHLLSACPFRSESSIFMWSPENDRVQHRIYEISSLIISTNHARAQLLSEMGASIHAVDPPDAVGLMSQAAGITDELEMSMRDGVEAVKNVGAFFSSNISSLGEKVMSVGSTSFNQGSAPTITESSSPSKGNFAPPKSTRGGTETECLTSLCNLASTLLDPLTELIRATLATLQSQGMEAVQVLQSLDALPIFGELAFLFSSYLVHMLSSIRISDQQVSQPDKPLLNKCSFVGSGFSGPQPSFYQHVAAFRSCIKAHYHGPSAQQVLCEILGGSVHGWRGLESLLYLSPSFRAFTTCVGEMARLSAHALPTYQCNENLFTCVITAVPYYIHCDQTLMTLLKHELVRTKYGDMVLEIAFQRLIKFFKKNVFFSEVHLLRQRSSKGAAQQEFWVSEGSYWIGVLNFLAEQRLMEGMVFRRHIFSRLCLAVSEGGAVPAFKSINGGSALLVCRPSVALESSLDEQATKPQNATARWVTSGGLRSVGRGIDASTGWTDLMSCDVQKASAASLSITGSSIPSHEVVILVSATMTLYHNLVFHEDHEKCSPHVWSDVLQFICRQCPADFVLGCLSNPLFSYDIRCAACKLTRRLAFQCSRRRFSMPIFSWSSERIVPTLDVECNRTTFYQWIDDFKLLTSILNNLLECFKPEEESRRPPPVVAIAILELSCEAIANNLWSDLASIKQLYAIFSDIFLRPLAPDQNRERALALNVINRYLPFLQGHYIKAIRDGFKFITVGPGEVVCSGRGLDSDPCIVICQFGELSLCYDDLGNGAVCIATVSGGDMLGLEILNFIASNWFDEDGLSAAPLKQQKCIATRPSKLWVITRSALLSAILVRSRVSDVLDPVSSIEVDARCLASSAMSLCLEVEQKKFCLEAVRQMRLHINLAPGIYLHPSRPLKQQRVSETLSLILGSTSASIVESLFRASGGRLLINDTKIFGFPIKIAACYIFAIHMIISLGLTTLKVLNRLGEVDDVTVGTNDSPSHEFLAVMFVAWFLCSSFGLYSVSMRKPRLIQWALIGHCFAVSVTILSLVASSYAELEKLPYAAILSKLASAMLAVFFEAFLFLIVLTYFALLSKKEALRASVELSEKNVELVDNLLVDHFSTNQLFASSSKTIFSQIASNDPRLSEAASHFFVNSCQNKAKLFAALESCVLLRTPQSEMVFQALVGACSELYKNSTYLIETVLSLSHPLSFSGNRRSWPPVIIDTGVLSQSGSLISILVDLKIKVSTISDTLRKEAAKYDDRSGGMSPSEWRRVAYASQLDKSLCIIVGVAQSICFHVSSFGSLQCSTDQGNSLVSICLDLMSWCCVEDTRWQEIVAELLCEVGPTIIFISPFQTAAAIAECCRNNMKVRTMHGKTMVSLLCSAFDDKNVKLLQSNQIEALIRAMRVVVAGSIVSATLPVEGVGELVVQHVLPFASKVLEDLGYVKCRFIECDDKDLQDAVEITSDSASDRQLVPCGRCGGTGVQQLFKCCFCDGRRYVSVSLSQAPLNNFFDEHELSVAPLAADSAPKVQIYGARPEKGSEWWARFGDKCCLETLYLLAVTCELGNNFISSQVRGVVSFDSVAKAACDPIASKEMRASLIRFCASVHIPAAVANNLDRRWANPVHPAWMITDALSRFVQDSPVSRLCDIAHDPNSASFLLLSIWTPVIELLCKRVLSLNTRAAMCNPIREILRRFSDSICISGYSSMNIAACQNAITCLTVLRALDIRPQSSMYQAFDHYVTQEVFAQHALASMQKTIDLSASTSDISALRWKSYITAIKPLAEHIEMIIANELIQAEPGIHLSTSVASAIAFNLCSSCCKGGYFFDQHGAWNDVVRGITQAIEPCASKLLKTSSIFSIKWIAEGVCNIVADSISMAALPSPHRFAHASGGLYLGIRFLSSFKHQGQELLVSAVLNRPDDSFFTGLIAIIDEAAVTAPRVSAFYNQVVQTLKREQSSYEAMPTLDKGAKPKSHTPTSIEEAKVWERLDELVTESSSCTLSKRLAFGGLASKFLQCWCEDHNTSVQDACAGQRPHGKSNPILSLASLVLVCSRQGCPPLQIITSLAIEAISESIQRPCKPQQAAVAQTDIVHACDDLILGRWSDGTDPSVVFSCNCPLAVPDSLRSVLQTAYSLPEIRHKACNLLLALVESLDMDSVAVETSTPLLILKAMRLEEHKKALSQLDRSSEQDLSTCASVVVVLLTLQPFVPKYGLWAAKALCIKSILNPDANSDIPIMPLVRKRIRCIDIVHRGVINRVWFSQPDVMEFRRDHYLQSIQRSIFDPSDRNAQFAAFVLLSLALIEQMLLDQRLSRNVFTKILTRAIGWIQYLFNLNALLINAIMLFAFEHPDQVKPSSIEGELFFNLSPDIVFRNEQYIFALRSLSAIQLTLSFSMFYWFMISDVSFIVRERIRQNPSWMKVFVNKRGGPEHFVIWCRSVVSNPRFLALSSYFITSILAVTLPDKFTPMLFLSLHLADVIYTSKDMKIVFDFIASVWFNLVTVIGFIFILLNIFGAVGFVWIPDWFELPEVNADWYPAVNGSISSGAAVEAPCTTLWRCFLIQVDKGLVLGDIDFGIVSTATSDVPASMMYSRIFYSFVFQVIVAILFSFILYTVVIDSFSKFRINHDELAHQIGNKCLICSLGRDELVSLHSDSFEDHIQSVHGLFDYIAFIAMIILKDRSTLTGIVFPGPEHSVFNCIVDVTPSGVLPKAKPDTTWLPYRAVASHTAAASTSSAAPSLQVFFSGVFCRVVCLIQQQEALRTAVFSTQKWMKGIISKTR